MLYRYLVVTYGLCQLRAETLYLVREFQDHLSAYVHLLVVFLKHGPERVFDATDEIIKATVFILRLVVVDVPYALLQRGRNHVFAQVLRIVAVPRISQQALCDKLEVFADLYSRLSLALAFLQLFRELL